MADAGKAEKQPKAPQGAKTQQGGGKQRAAKGGAAPAPAAAPATRARLTGEVPPRLRERFRAAVVPALMKERGYGNPFQVPRLEKIVINMGVGEGKENPKILDFATADLQAITGQKPVITRAKKSIANFKLRENVPIGCKVTLRGARMYEFLDRLVNVALPRVRDFKGVAPKAFDGRGNYALCLKEQVIIPSSKLKVRITEILKEEGFIKNFRLIEDKKQGTLRVYLKYGPGNEKIISGLVRVSKPGRRVYVDKDKIPSILGGMGVAILSTSRGVMTDRAVRKQQLGGEVLAYVW